MIIAGRVEKSPFQIGDPVRVVMAVDVEIYDVTPHIGKTGKIVGVSSDNQMFRVFFDEPFDGKAMTSGPRSLSMPDRAKRTHTYEIVGPPEDDTEYEVIVHGVRYFSPREKEDAELEASLDKLRVMDFLRSEAASGSNLVDAIDSLEDEFDLKNLR